MLLSTPAKSPTDEPLFLLSLKALDHANIHQYVTPTQLNNLHIIKQWVYDYLMCPHKMLGRKGPVCPYVPKAVKEDTIFLTVISPDKFNQAHFYETILNYFDWFAQLEPTDGNKRIYRSIIMLIDIPDENNHRIIEQTVADLKAQFVKKKAMLGEFHSDPPAKCGIRNPAFRPLMSPVPLLAIREMVETDIEFLKASPDYLQHYQQFFQHNIPESFQF